MYFLVLLASTIACYGEPMVRIPTLGTVSGRSTGDTWEFLGVPYGKAERWKPPTSLARTPFPNGHFNALKGGPCCEQLNLAAPAKNTTYTNALECLNMNIFTPANSPGMNLPVMVFSHGGAEVVGCSQDEVPHLYNGTGAPSSAW
eukprot:TRINITY_DN117520_c0_g1_i1.p1 TRINITY_DN117520_c0_g1~~TRINITY_DN117520_c0_g1_i1.p1  ORF type:complete len:145 (-),score=12.18 TRINITY_DN117520_c0_g1_i1:39-473(-)